MLLVVQQGREGDVITLDWLPDTGTLVSVNGEVMGQTIPGNDVYCALLRVWPGDHPTSTGLKRALLGQIGMTASGSQLTIAAGEGRQGQGAA